MTTFKSSSITFIYKYVFITIICVVLIFLLGFNWNIDKSILLDRNTVPVLLFSLGLFWMSILSYRLKSLMATNDSIIIKTFQGLEKLNYEDIVWVYQIAIGNPTLISIKYNIRNTNKSKTILVIPSLKSEFFKINLFDENNMTKFIREGIIATNPKYSKEIEPSKWLPALLIFFISSSDINIAQYLFSEYLSLT